MCKIVCCVCHKDMGRNDCPCNEVSHGYCEKCLADAMAEIDAWEEELDDDEN